MSGASTAGSRAAPASAGAAPIDVTDATWSPRPDPGAEGVERELVALCGAGDAALASAAREIAESLASGGEMPEPSDVQLWIRAHGAPYVWPRVWALQGPVQPRARLLERMQQWLAASAVVGQRRCGVALLPAGGAPRIALAIAVDALADLAPLPRVVRPSAWVDVSADLLVPSSSAKVVVLGPRGAPRTLPTSVRGQRVSARFSADAEGAWLVQVLAAPSGGPRPVVEALLHAGERGARVRTAPPAPGEDAAPPTLEPEAALARMIERARATEGLPPIARDAELDAIARAHAEAMRDQARVGHDLGAGDPGARVEQLGRPVTRSGENVAHAATAARAHRALWSSPSHRANLLDRHFDSIGIGVAVGSDGTLWVCEVFARFRR